MIATKVEATSIRTSSGFIKDSGSGRVFWLLCSNAHATVATLVRLTDDGVTIWQTSVPALTMRHFQLNPPLEFATNIGLLHTGGTTTTTVGYE